MPSCGLLKEETILSIDYRNEPLVKVENKAQSHIGFVRLGENIQPILDIDGSETKAFFLKLRTAIWEWNCCRYGKSKKSI